MTSGQEETPSLKRHTNGDDGTDCGWATLVQSDLCPFKKKRFQYGQILRESHVRRQRKVTTYKPPKESQKASGHVSLRHPASNIITRQMSVAGGHPSVLLYGKPSKLVQCVVSVSPSQCTDEEVEAQRRQATHCGQGLPRML